ncbi:transposase [Kitasatospora hibisci]|uniref:transposase n=1 Tax=Kitasatospora hibisci TaxID=3369522 RepID=UPI0037543685
MVMKHYPPEFKADAVALYESRPGSTIKSVADDLGINPETLRNWTMDAHERLPDEADRSRSGRTCREPLMSILTDSPATPRPAGRAPPGP